MTIFNIPTDSTPEAEKLARGFLAEANAKFEAELNSAYDTIQRFWYRNDPVIDEETGESVPQLEGDKPSGIEILQAMGTNAKASIDVAYARVQMLLNIEAGLGLSGVVDVSRLQAPYNLVFAQDGSLQSYTLR